MAEHGANVVLGIAQGIAATTPRVIASVTAMATALRAAGEAAVEGLAAGMRSMDAELEATVAELGALAEAAVRDRLQISSPSKVMYELGVMAAQGLANGMAASPAPATAASQVASKLLSSVSQALSEGVIGSGTASSLTSWLTADNNRLTQLASQRAAIAKTIATAQSYASTTASNTASAYGLTTAATSAYGAPVTGATIAASLQADVAQIRQFGANIKKLAAMGLNKAYIDQLIQAGPASGGPVAEALIASGIGEIRQVNSAESQISAASTSLGQTAANAMYDSGAMAGKGFLSGLEAQQSAITKMMQQIAESMVSTIRKELGIASPSRVMFDHGLLAAQGLALGIAAGAGQVRSASRSLASAVSGPDVAAVTSGRTSPVPIVINQTTQVKATVNEQVLFEAHQQETFRYNIRNSGQVTGAVKPGT
jgi:hypothetical protein